MDQQIEGVHFPSGLDPRLVGRRLVAVNLSDLAAVGAVPAYALLAAAVPAGYDAGRLLASVHGECRKQGLRLAGGDVAHAPRMSAGLTLLGRQGPGGRWLRRRGARRGDQLWIGGALGESAAGRLLLARGAAIEGRRVVLPPEFRAPAAVAAAARRAVRRHLLPTPQLELGAWLTRRRAAAIDVSDGLALDLHRLCRESGVAATVDGDALPRPRGLDELAARLGREALDLVLGGGEDYCLLFTLPPGERPPPRHGGRRIGDIGAGHGVRLRIGAERRPLKAAGWDHLDRTDTLPAHRGERP